MAKVLITWDDTVLFEKQYKDLPAETWRGLLDRLKRAETFVDALYAVKEAVE